MGRIAQASILLSLFLTAIFVGGRLMQYGIEKVTSDWCFYVGFFRVGICRLDLGDACRD